MCVCVREKVFTMERRISGVVEVPIITSSPLALWHWDEVFRKVKPLFSCSLSPHRGIKLFLIFSPQMNSELKAKSKLACNTVDGQNVLMFSFLLEQYTPIPVSEANSHNHVVQKWVKKVHARTHAAINQLRVKYSYWVIQIKYSTILARLWWFIPFHSSKEDLAELV